MYLNPAGSELLSLDIDNLRSNVRASNGLGYVMTGDYTEYQSLRFQGYHGLERYRTDERVCKCIGTLLVEGASNTMTLILPIK